ncbi:MAG: dephospho-CoA kinase [Elusimicrobiota bacterium]
MQKLIIGLTGGYGSGKSTVSAMLRSLGARIVDADVLAREALRPGTPSYKKMVRAFGPAVLRPGGAVDRARLADVVFRRPASRRALEKIVHPYVVRRLKEETARSRRGILVLDVPLLYEAGLSALPDRTVVVWAPEALRRRRLARRGVSAAEFRRRAAAQWPLSAKRRRARHVIDNSGPLSRTRRQTRRLWEEWRELAR